MLAFLLNIFNYFRSKYFYAFGTPNPTTNYTCTITEPTKGYTNFVNVLVTVVAYCVYIRNAFTPNGDGYNDKCFITDSYDCIKSA